MCKVLKLVIWAQRHCCVLGYRDRPLTRAVANSNFSRVPFEGRIRAALYFSIIGLLVRRLVVVDASPSCRRALGEGRFDLPPRPNADCSKQSTGRKIAAFDRAVACHPAAKNPSRLEIGKTVEIFQSAIVPDAVPLPLRIVL
jgi:hypothetical protein